MPKGIERHGNRFRTEVMVDGRRDYYSSTDLDEVIKWKEEAQRRASFGDDHFDIQRKHVMNSLDIQNYSDYFLREHATRVRKIKTIQDYRTMFRWFITFFNKEKRVFYLNEITTKDIREFRLAFLEGYGTGKPRKPSTWNHMYKVCKLIFDQAVLDYKKYFPDERSPLIGLKRDPKSRKPAYHFTPEQVEDLVNRAEAWLKIAIMILYFTAIRRSELMRLRWRDIIINKPGEKDRIIIKETKIEIPREIYIHEKLRDFLVPYKLKGKPDDPVLRRMRKDRINGEQFIKHPTTLSHAFKRLCLESKDSEVRKYGHLHTLRHSMATHMGEQGATLQELQSVLGHLTKEMVEHYSHLTFKGTETVMKKFKSDILVEDRGIFGENKNHGGEN